MKDTPSSISAFISWMWAIVWTDQASLGFTDRACGDGKEEGNDPPAPRGLRATGRDHKKQSLQPRLDTGPKIMFQTSGGRSTPPWPLPSPRSALSRGIFYWREGCPDIHPKFVPFLLILTSGAKENPRALGHGVQDLELVLERRGLTVTWPLSENSPFSQQLGHCLGLSSFYR